MSDSKDANCCISEGDPCENCCPVECCGRPRWKTYAEAPVLVFTDPIARAVFAITFIGKMLWDVMLFQVQNSTILGYDTRWGQSLPSYAFWTVLATCSIISIAKFRWEIAPAVLAFAGMAGRMTWGFCSQLSANCWSGSLEFGIWMEFAALGTWIIWIVICSYLPTMSFGGDKSMSYPPNIGGAYDPVSSKTLLNKPQQLQGIKTMQMGVRR